MTIPTYDLEIKKQLLHRHNLTITSIAAATTLGDEEVVLCDATGGVFTVTLPAVSLSKGKMYRIMKTDSSANAVTVDGNASETIDGATTNSLASQYDDITIVCDGSEWFIF